MKFPSLELVLATSLAALRRFPLPLGCAAVTTVAALTQVTPGDRDARLMHLAFVGSLGLPLFTAMALHRDARALSRPVATAWIVAGLALLIFLFVVWPSWSNPVQERRYLQLSLALHLLAAFLPFASGATLNAFWQYNRTLFLGFLTAALFTFVLFVGLAIAMAAVDQLFGVRIDEHQYLRLALVLGLMFNTWYFLGNLPHDMDSFAHDESYPRGLRIFSQYILLPIVGVYLVILTLYMGKIVITRQWPSGWIGYLVSSVSTLGILSVLLLHPIEERHETRWVKTYARWFYVLLLPSLVMLLLAIWKRIDQYGITENRYFLVILAVWLAIIAIYFATTRSRNIRVIPLTLCLLALSTSFGPWGAYAVSKHSQTQRLKQMLEAEALLVNERLQQATHDLDFTTRKEISNVLTYLIQTHGSGILAAWLGGNEALAQIDTIGPPANQYGTSNARDRAKLVLQHLGVPFVPPWEGEATQQVHFTAASRPVMVRGYDYALGANQGLPLSFSVESREYELRFDNNADKLLLLQRDLPTPTLEIPLDALVQHLASLGPSPERLLTEDPLLIEAANDDLRVLVAVTEAFGQRMNGRVDLQHLSANFFMSWTHGGH